MKRRNAFCSFCRKSYSKVGPLIEGPDEAYICAECVELCQSIIEQERRRRSGPPQPVGPAAIHDRLDQLVNGQDEAKQALVQAVGAGQYVARCVLLLGPSRSAQILLARALAHILEGPFAAGDAAGLVRVKQGPADVVPLLFSLLQACAFDGEAAKRGVVFVDGLERPEAQDALLRLWQESARQPVPGFDLGVRGILFVCGADFAGLDEGAARLGRHPEQPVTAEVLTAVGARPDWAGYLAGIARVEPLGEDEWARVVRWVDFRRCEEDPP